MSTIQKFVASLAVMTIFAGLFIRYRRALLIDNIKTFNDPLLWKHNRTRTSFPSTAFFHNLAKYYRWMENLQAYLDTAARTRQGVIGNIGWHPSQLYYYARSASFDWISNICEIGYGAGHSTLLYLLINPEAHIYSFDLFPDNKDDQVHTPGETLLFQQAFQAVTLKAIDNDIKLASRFHKIIGNSNSTIPKFIRENAYFKCDFLSIDGSHNPPQPFFDVLNSQRLAHKQTIVILDDMQTEPMRRELEKAIDLRILYKYECLKPEMRVDLRFSSVETYYKEFCVARYQNVNEKRS
jgi:hypothetical protein